MEYKEATDPLFSIVDSEEFASRLGTSRATMFQARMTPGNKGYRSPPKNWVAPTIEMLEERISFFQETVARLRREAGPERHGS